MKTGDPVLFVFQAWNAAGEPACGRSVGDFVLTVDGVTVAPSAFEDRSVADGGNANEYALTFTAPDTTSIHLARVQPLPGGGYWADRLFPDLMVLDLTASDDDSIMAQLAVAQGLPSAALLADGDLGSIVDGDSYYSPIAIQLNQSRLGAFGITDLNAVGITIRASVKLSSADAPVTLPAVVIASPGTLLQVYLNWDGGAGQPFGALASGKDSRTWYGDIEVIKSASPNKIITAYRFSFNQIWDREVRVA